MNFEILKEDKYMESILNRFISQIQKGRIKYGKPLCEYPFMEIKERLEHLMQELTDALEYGEHLSVFFDSIKTDILDIIKYYKENNLDKVNEIAQKYGISKEELL